MILTRMQGWCPAAGGIFWRTCSCRHPYKNAPRERAEEMPVPDLHPVIPIWRDVRLLGSPAKTSKVYTIIKRHWYLTAFFGGFSC